MGSRARTVKRTDMATTLTKLLTADDLLRLDSQGVRGELIRGVLHETMSTGLEHGEIAVNLSAELRNFVKPRRLGRLVTSDVGVWLERDPDTVREPDIAYFSAETLSPSVRFTGYAEVPPDSVVEIVSPSDSHGEVYDKAADVAQLRRAFGVGGAAGHPHRGCVSAGPAGGDAQ